MNEFWHCCAVGYKMKKRVGAVEEFEFEPLVVVGKQLHVTVAITGWLSKEMPGNHPLNRER